MRLNFTTTNILTDSDYISIHIPPGYSFDSSITGSVCTNILFQCIPQIQDNLNIKVTGNFSN
jgi:hypothetical protein